MESDHEFAAIFNDSPSLGAAFVTAMPDGLLYQSWGGGDQDWQQDEVAALVGDLVRASREVLEAMSSKSSDTQITVESHELLVVLRELNRDFACGLVFPSGTALGLVHVEVRRLVERIREWLSA